MSELILIVDDELDTVKLAKRLLEIEGFNVITAYDGEEALNQVYNEKPILILLDIKIPKIDGYDVCKKIKENPDYKDTKIIMFTAKVFEKDKIKGKEVGADDYITKPFSGDDLVRKIKELLNKK